MEVQMRQEESAGEPITSCARETIEGRAGEAVESSSHRGGDESGESDESAKHRG